MQCLSTFIDRMCFPLLAPAEDFEILEKIHGGRLNTHGGRLNTHGGRLDMEWKHFGKMVDAEHRPTIEFCNEHIKDAKSENKDMLSADQRAIILFFTLGPELPPTHESTDRVLSFAEAHRRGVSAALISQRTDLHAQFTAFSSMFGRVLNVMKTRLKVVQIVVMREQHGLISWLLLVVVVVVSLFLSFLSLFSFSSLLLDQPTRRRLSSIFARSQINIKPTEIITWAPGVVFHTHNFTTATTNGDIIQQCIDDGAEIVLTLQVRLGVLLLVLVVVVMVMVVMVLL
jgi:hypothetical protein